jgi:hypothetical protein
MLVLFFSSVSGGLLCKVGWIIGRRGHQTFPSISLKKHINRLTREMNTINLPVFSSFAYNTLRYIRHQYVR